jgi:hypothetical protein
MAPRREGAPAGPLGGQRRPAVFSRDPDVAMIKVMRDRQARYVSFDQYASLSRFDA